MPAAIIIRVSAQDISFCDIGLAGSVLIHKPENGEFAYTPWQLPDGTEMPVAAGAQLKKSGSYGYKRFGPGLLFISQPFNPSVCVTLLVNKEGVDFTNRGRCIVEAFWKLLSTGYDDNRLFLLEGQFSVADSIARLEEALRGREFRLAAAVYFRMG